MAQPVVLDVETQNTFREVGGYDPAKLKISLAGLYDYQSDKYLAFVEDEMAELFPYLEKASFVIGFNIIDFDLPAISPYYVGRLDKLPTLDLLREVEIVLGHRLSLNDLAMETLNTKKSGHGLMAIDYFRNGEIEKLKKYCLDDVKITRQLFEYGKTHGKIFYRNVNSRREIPVNWGKKHDQIASEVNLTLPL